MNRVYFTLVLVNAWVSFAAAIAVFLKNRHQQVGPLFGATMFVLAIWLLGFAQYFREMDEDRALAWAAVTLAASTVAQSVWFHTLCAMVDKVRRLRWWIIASYAVTLAYLMLLWQGNLVVGVIQAPNMAHYIRYNRFWYSSFGLHSVFWQLLGIGITLQVASQARGYKRTQLVYFIAAWFIVFLTTSSIVIPIEYGLNIPPFGFFLLPVNLAFLAYVMGRARLADYNVVIARVLLFVVTVLIIVAISLAFVGVMILVAPGFMDQRQIAFSVLMAITIGAAVALGLPRLLPRAERIMQERLFGSRAGYQEALAGLVRQLGTLPNLDELFATVADRVHSQMQLTRVMILVEDTLSGRFRQRAESGANAESPETFDLEESAPLLRWLRENKRLLVREELARQIPERAMREIAVDLDRLGVSVCVPTIVDDKLTGFMALGPKTNRDMFFISDLNLLGNLATELALVVKYRRVEEEIFHKNKLIELGTIAAGVAHEIRNPLTSITTLAQLLPEQMDDPEFRSEFAKRVIEDVERIKKVIDNMLSFARPTQFTMQPYSLNELVDDSIMLTKPKLKSKNVELTKQCHESPLVNVDKPKIQQVLINLISNAVDAIADNGKIRIATGVRMMEDAGNGNHQRRFAVIEVADNGSGIPAAVRSRLFDPFFTTKKDGTGLGLSISQKIVRDHGGIISVSSVEGKGTTFQVNLPVS